MAHVHKVEITAACIHRTFFPLPSTMSSLRLEVPYSPLSSDSEVTVSFTIVQKITKITSPVPQAGPGSTGNLTPSHITSSISQVTPNPTPSSPQPTTPSVAGLSNMAISPPVDLEELTTTSEASTSSTSRSSLSSLSHTAACSAGQPEQGGVWVTTAFEQPPGPPPYGEPEPEQ